MTRPLGTPFLFVCFLMTFSLRQTEARTYVCTDRYNVNMNFGSFNLHASEKNLEVSKLEFSTPRLADITRNDIRALREKNELSEISSRDRQHIAKYEFDFLGEVAPYTQQHPPVKYKTFIRFRPTQAMSDAFAESSYGQLKYVVVRPEITLDRTVESGRLPDVVFQYKDREGGNTEAFSCH